MDPLKRIGEAIGVWLCLFFNPPMILLHVFRWTFNKSWRGVALVLLFAVIALPKSGGPCNSGKDKRCKNCCDYRLMANDLHCSFPFVFVVLFSASRSEAKVFFDFLPNVKSVARRRLIVQSEANERRYPPLPPLSCSLS